MDPSATCGAMPGAGRPGSGRAGRGRGVIALSATLGGLFTLTCPAEEPSPIITVPVRVHLMRSESRPAMHTTLDEGDVRRIFGKVNRIWSQAGIRLEIESIRRTDAVAPAPDATFDTEHERVTAMIPRDALSPSAIDVCYVREITSNGFYYGEPAVVKDTARLNEVAGGIDEPIPRVTAHELGHAFGLRHRQDGTNLMSSKNSGFSLNEAEIERARDRARRLQAR